jgi:hypothetical protein
MPPIHWPRQKGCATRRLLVVGEKLDEKGRGRLGQPRQVAYSSWNNEHGAGSTDGEVPADPLNIANNYHYQDNI